MKADTAVLERPPRPAAGLTRPATVLGCLTLVLTIALGAFAVSTSVTLAATGGGERAEWSLYAAAFGVILPLSVYGGMALARLLDRRGTLTVTAVAWSSSLLTLLVLARLHFAADNSAGFGSLASLAAVLTWLAGVAAVGWLAIRRPSHPTLERIHALGPKRLFAAPGVLLLALLLGFSRGLGLAPAQVALALVIAAGLLGVHLLLLRRRCPRRLGIVLDLSVVALLALVMNDLTLHQQPQRFFGSLSGLHQNFYLGPVNDLLHGRAMLVDTFSQYGVGPFYLLAGWFQLATPGYGGLALVSGLLTAAMVALAYFVLRLGETPRPLALAATAVVAVAAFFHPLQPPTFFPSAGGLRLMLPYLLVAAGLLAQRRGERPGVLRLAVPVVLAVASLWSLETFVYCLAAFGGMAATSAAAGAGGLRAFGRRLGSELRAPALAIVLAHLLFAVLTRALAGQWPDWGRYLEYIGAYSVDGLGALPVGPWSAGVLIGGVYLASLAGVVVLRVHAPRLFWGERIALTGVAGMGLFGFASLSYFVGRSFPGVAEILSPPCIVVVALWLGILERSRASVPRFARLGTLSAASVAIGMLVVFSRPTLEDRGARTPLAIGLLGVADGGSLRGELARMWRSEPLDDRVAGARRLLRRHFPGDGPVLVVAESERTTDLLVQSGRVNVLPVSHFLQDGVLIGRTWPTVARTIDGLAPGTLMLTERERLNPVSSREPTEIDLLTRDAEVLLRRTKARINARFRLEAVDRAGRFTVARLQPRRPS